MHNNDNKYIENNNLCEKEIIVDDSIIKNILNKKQRKIFIEYIEFLIRYETKIINNISFSFSLNEKQEKYIYDKEKVHNYHDTAIRKILSNREEAAILINKVLELTEEEQINSDNLELYESSLISKSYINREADIIYKRKDMNVFFIIEHQSRVDYDMPIRIIEYVTQIITNYWNSRKNRKKDRLYPLVIPIVLYIGNKKWNVEEFISNRQVKMPGYKKEYGKYTVFDANNYTDKDLLESKGVLSKIILLEKTKDNNDLENKYEQISKTPLSKEEKEMIIEYLCNVSSSILRDEEINKIKKIFMEGGNSMLAEMLMENQKKAYLGGKREGIKEGKREGERAGIKKAKIQIAKELLKSKLEIKDIERCTKLKEEEIIKIKKSLKS